MTWRHVSRPAVSMRWRPPPYSIHTAAGRVAPSTATTTSKDVATTAVSSVDFKTNRKGAGRSNSVPWATMRSVGSRKNSGFQSIKKTRVSAGGSATRNMRRVALKSMAPMKGTAFSASVRWRMLARMSSRVPSGASAYCAVSWRVLSSLSATSGKWSPMIRLAAAWSSPPRMCSKRSKGSTTPRTAAAAARAMNP